MRLVVQYLDFSPKSRARGDRYVFEYQSAVQRQTPNHFVNESSYPLLPMNLTTRLIQAHCIRGRLAMRRFTYAACASIDRASPRE